jgi:hypothetical protein
MTARWIVAALLVLPSVAIADEAPSEEQPERVAKAETPAQSGPRSISGMSILGNQEAPKSLVIVPWKSSELGESIAVESMLDDSRRPVDKDVFTRELGYYEISTE